MRRRAVYVKYSGTEVQNWKVRVSFIRTTQQIE